MESVSKPELVSATDPVFEYLVEIIHQGNLTVVGPQICGNACPAVGFVESPVQQALFACRERCCPTGCAISEHDIKERVQGLHLVGEAITTAAVSKIRLHVDALRNQVKGVEMLVTAWSQPQSIAAQC